MEIGGKVLEVVYSSRLLGIQITSDCRWNEHVANMISKANIKMWFLRRLKNLGASTCTLKEVYSLFVRQALEFAAPVWTSSLSKQNIKNLEKLQAFATDIILGPNSMSYEQRMRELSLISLEERRWNITSKFAEKFSKDPDFSYLFPQRKSRVTHSSTKFVETRAFNRQSMVSPIPTYMNLLNEKEI